jgi:hypothetical protein
VPLKFVLIEPATPAARKRKKHLMRLALAALALIATVASASAGYTCTTYGNQTHCTDDTHCYRVGARTYCN